MRMYYPRTCTAAGGGPEADHSVLNVDPIGGDVLKAAPAVPLAGPRPIRTLCSSNDNIYCWDPSPLK